MGRFTLASLREGVYSIDLYASVYRLEGRERWESIEVRPGEERTFRFTCGGVISGRVIDERGEPVAGMSVAAIRLKDKSDRRPENFSSSDSPRRFTDDRGYYRLFNLAPGSYYMAANFTNVQQTNDGIYQDASMIYHTAPGAEGRTAVQVVDGGETEGIDLVYRGERGARVSGGLITGIEADEKPRAMRVVIADREARALIGIYDTSTMRPSYVLTGLAEGDYDLLAYGGSDGPIPLMSQVHRLAIRRGETRSLDLRLEQPGAIAGTVELSMPKDSAVSCPPAGRIEVKRIKIRAKEDHRSNDYVLPLFAYRCGTQDESGRFMLDGLRAGEYLIEVELPNEGWRLGSIVLLDQITQQGRTLNYGEIIVPVRSGQETKLKIVVTPVKMQLGDRGCAK